LNVEIDSIKEEPQAQSMQVSNDWEILLSVDGWFIPE
jgi:hypothetical protein